MLVLNMWVWSVLGILTTFSSNCGAVGHQSSYLSADGWCNWVQWPADSAGEFCTINRSEWCTVLKTFQIMHEDKWSLHQTDVAITCIIYCYGNNKPSRCRWPAGVTWVQRCSLQTHYNLRTQIVWKEMKWFTFKTKEQSHLASDEDEWMAIKPVFSPDSPWGKGQLYTHYFHLSIQLWKQYFELWLIYQHHREKKIQVKVLHSNIDILKWQVASKVIMPNCPSQNDIYHMTILKLVEMWLMLNSSQFWG